MKRTGHLNAVEEPFEGLFTQGMVVHETYQSSAGKWLLPGEVRFEGRDLVTMPAERLRALRGHRIGVVFQDPSTSLNPVHPIGAQIADEVSALAAYLQTRLPGPDVTPEQLRARSWWRGPDVFVLVDDYDLVTGGSGTPLAPLVPLLGQAGDVGLHLVLARRSGGAARALYDPVIQTLRDCAAPGLVLSGSPDEGALVGSVRPQQRVPGRGTLVARSVGTQVVQIAVASIERPAAG